MTDRDPAEADAARPNTDLQPLQRLIGSWRVSGGAEGTVRYEWMEGGFFVVQHVDLEQFGMRVIGIEVIGHLQPFGEAPGPDIRSRFFDSMGNTLDYVYEPNPEGSITIWGGEKGSPAYCTNTFSNDDASVTSEWVYPGGGGYQSVMTRT